MPGEANPTPMRLALVQGDLDHRPLDEERRRDIERLTGTLTWEADANARITYLSNTAWQNAIDRGALSGRHLMDAFSATLSAASLGSALTAGRAFSDLAVRLKSDPMQGGRLSGRPLKDDAGALCGWRGVLCLRDAPSINSNSASYKLLGLMSESLLRRAQDLLMTSLGALELARDGDAGAFSAAEAAVKACLDLQTNFVGFCKSHLVEGELTLAAPTLARAAHDVSLETGRGEHEVIALHSDDLLVFATEDEFYQAAREFILSAIASAPRGVERILIHLPKSNSGDGGLTIAASMARGSGQAHHDLADTVSADLGLASFSPTELIARMRSKAENL